MISLSIKGNWKDRNASFRSHVPIAEMNRLEASVKTRNWQRPQWLQVIEQSAGHFAQLHPNENGLHLVTPEMQHQDMCQGRIHAARALAYAYWNILKDYWPALVPTVAEMGCGAHLSLYELFPHEDLPNHWQAFDLVRGHIEHAARSILRFTKWPVKLTIGNAYQPPFEKADILIGQSSYDSVYKLATALEAARSKVKFFVHFQEVNPLIEPIFHFVTDFPAQRRDWLTDITDTEFDSRFAQEASERFHKELTELTADESEEIFPRLFNDIIGEERERLAFRLPGGEFVGVQDEFQARLNFCLEQTGYKILKTGIAQGMYLGEKLRHHQNLPNVRINAEPEQWWPPNSYIWAGAWAKHSWTTEVKAPFFKETAYVRYVIAEA